MIRIRKIYFLIAFIIIIILMIMIGMDFLRISGPDLLTCYGNNTNNNLPSIQSENVAKNTSFFFVETSCHNSYLHLTARQLCSIESAALLNPSSKVYLLIPSPIREPEMFDQRTKTLLKSYKNIKFLHIKMIDFFKSTPLQKWYAEDGLQRSRWPRTHASDILRFTILWKYGGIYVDLDVVLLKSFEGLSNFAGIESYKENVLASSLISFTQDHPVSDIAIREIRDRFNGFDWGYNGPGVITRALQQYCAVSEVSEMDKCSGFTIYPPKVFTPIHWKNWRGYFSYKEADSILAQLNNSLAVHFWNNFSHDEPVKVGSGQVYDKLAARFCPRVYSTLGANGSTF